MSDIDRLRAALVQIAEAANAAVNDEYTDDEPPNQNGHSKRHNGNQDTASSASPGKLVCTPKSLSEDLLVEAAQTAVRINPVNQPALAMFASAAPGLEITPEFISALTSKYWGPGPLRLTVSFLDAPPRDLRRRILLHMNAWNRTANVQFVETSGVGQVRISRGPGGYYSYLGTDILHIPQNQQTMNLQGFTMNTPESEYKRVVRHETGHTLGFPHEHMRKALVALIDPQKAYAFFLRTQGWSHQMVDQQVLTSLDERALMSTPPDQTSIMCYQLPGSITRNGKPILGGTDIDPTDYDFAGRIYPKPHHALGLDLASSNDQDAAVLEEYAPASSTLVSS